MRAPAVFKCVRVTGMDDGDDEYSYQTTVMVAGHVFRGFLYNEGVEDGDGYPNLRELHLGDGSAGGDEETGGRGDGESGSDGGGGATSSSPMLDPSDVSATPSGRLIHELF